ncbi:hypothetical protein G3N55_12505, partial [Dissulfurirhabdus thermomarina]|nr:hypothetical protein [Dissulfurirhabdus thermomarina]
VRVGVIGVTGTFYGGIRRRGDVEILDPRQVLAPVVAEVRRKADLVVLLSNLGDTADRAIVRAVPGIDLVIGSGAGSPRGGLPAEGRTVLLRTHPRGKSIGVARVRVQGGSVPPAIQNRLVMLTGNLPEDPEARERVRAALHGR